MCAYSVWAAAAPLRSQRKCHLHVVPTGHLKKMRFPHNQNSGFKHNKLEGWGLLLLLFSSLNVPVNLLKYPKVTV